MASQTEIDIVKGRACEVCGSLGTPLAEGMCIDCLKRHRPDVATVMLAIMREEEKAYERLLAERDGLLAACKEGLHHLPGKWEGVRERMANAIAACAPAEKGTP